ncbi:GntR family transcriptional regulator [Candidatus Enterococcus mansonii]|uniref:HTH gntR-type domain-containing protein n=1 Tax=Candidatus Enterococcus mansonii TaxID=1834181 RepID=A0A242CCM6_9ENTE|nr:GntR family transcriptional regulator [Enterococcus sp. 4G2_DIV0659]OTO07961.1 hypothetical protein A5880_002231 [Enterococcus sp. 4G2_DIV0659]
MNNEISSNSSEPLYIQLAHLIENKILSGIFSYGEKIPSEGDLVTEYNLSRVTVRKALQKLADEGIVEKKQGKGAYVAFPVYKETFSAGGSFTSSGKTTQNNPTSQILSKENLSLSDSLKIELGFKEPDVIMVKRLRKFDQQPVIFEIDYFTQERRELVNSLKDDDSLIEKLQALDDPINHFDNIIDIFFATKEMAQQLQLEVNTPLLHIQQQVFDSHNELIYTNEQFIHSEVYKAAIRSY